MSSHERHEELTHQHAQRVPSAPLFNPKPRLLNKFCSFWCFVFSKKIKRNRAYFWGNHPENKQPSQGYYLIVSLERSSCRRRHLVIYIHNSKHFLPKSSNRKHFYSSRYKRGMRCLGWISPRILHWGRGCWTSHVRLRISKIENTEFSMILGGGEERNNRTELQGDRIQKWQGWLDWRTDVEDNIFYQHVLVLGVNHWLHQSTSITSTLP